MEQEEEESSIVDNRYDDFSIILPLADLTMTICGFVTKICQQKHMKEAGRRSINIKLRIAYQFRHFLQADVRPASDDPHMRLKVDKIEKKQL